MRFYEDGKARAGFIESNLWLIGNLLDIVVHVTAHVSVVVAVAFMCRRVVRDRLGTDIGAAQ